MRMNTLWGVTEHGPALSRHSMNAPHACRRRSSFDHITWAQCSGAKKRLKKGNKQKHLPHWPEPLSPLACQPSRQCALLNPSLHFFCLSSKTQLSSKLPLPLCFRSRGCVPLILLQPLGLCCPTAFPGSKVKVLAGGQGFYLLPLWCSFPSAPESLLHPEKDSIMLNKNPEIN